MKLNFAPARLTELGDIMAIERAGFSAAEAASREAMAERIKLIPDTFIVAHDEFGHVVGYIVGPASDQRYIRDDLFDRVVPNQQASPYLTVLSLAVSPKYQGQGVGGHLLHAFDKAARQQRRAAISLTCLAKLVPFYESHGYVNEGVAASKHAGETWYNMVRTL